MTALIFNFSKRFIRACLWVVIFCPSCKYVHSRISMPTLQLYPHVGPTLVSESFVLVSSFFALRRQAQKSQGFVHFFSPIGEQRIRELYDSLIVGSVNVACPCHWDNSPGKTASNVINPLLSSLKFAVSFGNRFEFATRIISIFLVGVCVSGLCIFNALIKEGRFLAACNHTVTSRYKIFIT